MFQDGQRGGEGVNTHAYRASHVSRKIVPPSEDDFVSQRLLHGDIGTPQPSYLRKLHSKYGLGQVAGGNVLVEAGIIDAEVLEDGCDREVLVVWALRVGEETTLRKLLASSGKTSGALFSTWFSIPRTIIPKDLRKYDRPVSDLYPCPCTACRPCSP